jgi:penicillin-binding protein 1A
VGAEDRSVHFESLALGSGANMALPIWGLFMQKVLADPTLDIDPSDVFEAAPGMNINLNCDGSDDEIQSATVVHDDFF